MKLKVWVFAYLSRTTRSRAHKFMRDVRFAADRPTIRCGTTETAISSKRSLFYLPKIENFMILIKEKVILIPFPPTPSYA